MSGNHEPASAPWPRDCQCCRGKLSHTEHVNALGGQNDEFLILKRGYIHYLLGVKEMRIRESPQDFFVPS